MDTFTIGAIVLLIIIGIFHLMSKVKIRAIEIPKHLQDEIKAVDRAYEEEIFRWRKKMDELDQIVDEAEAEHQKKIAELNYWRDSIIEESVEHNLNIRNHD